MKVVRYCKCGGGMSVEVLPGTRIEQVNAIWEQVHSEPGCGDCDAETSRKARVATERREREDVLR